MRYIIVCNGEVNDYNFLRNEVKRGYAVLACDGGISHCITVGVRPSVVIGDFDSASERVLAHCDTAQRIPFPAQKDKTDTELAVDLVLGRGDAETITLLAATGGRFDHYMGNVGLLYKCAKRGVNAAIVDEYQKMFVVADGDKTVINRAAYETVALLPLFGDAAGVTTTGLRYALDDEPLNVGSSRGVSNEFDDDKATVSVKDGAILVVLSE